MLTSLLPGPEIVVHDRKNQRPGRLGGEQSSQWTPGLGQYKVERPELRTDMSSGTFRGRKRQVADGARVGNVRSISGKWAVLGAQALPEAEGMGHLRLGTVSPEGRVQSAATLVSGNGPGS